MPIGHKAIIASLSFLAVIDAASAQEADYFVDASRPNDSGDGESWPTAKRTLQAVLNLNLQDGDVVWCAEGEYTPSVPTSCLGELESYSFVLPHNEVSIYGGFPQGGGDETFNARNPLVYKSILNGLIDPLDAQGGGGEFENCPNGLTGGDCLTVTNGIPGCSFTLCCEAVCTILPECCAIEWDQFCVDQANLEGFACLNQPVAVRHVVTAFACGPSTVLNGFTISGGFDDGGDSSACTFGYPPYPALVGGAGLKILSPPIIQGLPTVSNPTIVLCDFIDNQSTVKGGAVDVQFSQGGGAGATFIDCRFLGNSAEDDGGAINNDRGTLTLINCVFSGNSSEDDGGAIMNDSTSMAGSGTLTAINCTFSRNIADGNGGGIRSADPLTLTNCILWGNDEGSGTTETAQLSVTRAVTVTYTCIQNLSAFAGDSNIGTSPQFIDDDGTDNTVGTRR